MRKLKFTYTVLSVALLCGIRAFAQDPALIQAYIDQHKNMAMTEQIRVGIPAAITLAQGIHETNAGTSELAVKANNHFGIKCKSTWRGKTMAHTDDRPNECFRKYDSEIESYKDHSDFLKNNPRYASLFKLSTTDYAAWAIGLRRAGYATNPQYAQKLIKIIEDYKLQEYTYAAMGNNPFSNSYDYAKGGEVVPNNDNGTNVPNMPAVPPGVTTTPVPLTPPAPVVKTTVSNSGVKVQQQEPAVQYGVPDYGKLVRVNGLKAVYGKKGVSPLEYAMANSIRYNKLLMLNELKDEPLPADMFIYLERKNFKGIRPMHMVKPGESMHIIAQMEGVQLNSLLAMNLLEEGEEALPGTTLELQRDAKVKPKTWASLNDDNKTNTQNNITSNSGDEQTVVVVDTVINITPTVARQTNSTVPTNPRYVPTKRTPVDTAVQQVPVTTTKVAATNTTNTVPTNPRFVPTTKVPVDTVTDAEDDVVVTTTTSTAKTVTANPRFVPNTKAVVDTVATAPAVDRTPIPQPRSNPRYVSTRRNKVDTIAVTTPINDKVDDNKPTINPAVVATVPVTTATTMTTSKSAYIETKKVIPVDKDVVKVDASNDDAQRNTKSGVIEPAKEDAPPVVQVVEPVKQPALAVQQQPVNNVDTPKTELDRLKSQFDRVIYTSNSTPTTTKTTTAKPQNKTVATTTASTKKDDDPSKYYTVKKGDTAFSISKMHNISMSNLMDWNNLDFTPITEGMKLKVKK